MTNLNGKVALITGGARGQGRAHAYGLAEAGADIVLMDLCAQVDTVAYPMSAVSDLEETADGVRERGRRVLHQQGDVRDLGFLRELVAQTRSEFGRLDIVVANAGILATIGEHADDDDAYYDSVGIMLNGVWNTIRAAAPVLVEQGEGGSIVLISSTAGLKGLSTEKEAGSAGYAASKHGVVGLMRTYANILAPHSIRVNTLHPTGVNSPMVANEAFGQYAIEHPEVAASLQNALPVSLIEPEDVTHALLWLVSDAARYVTGVTLPIDAGFTVRA